MNILATLTLALLLTSASALQVACPDLAGNYTCQGKHRTYDVAISQSMDSDGVTSYTMSYTDSDGKEKTKTLIADGMDQVKGDWRINASCGADTLQVSVTSNTHNIQATYSRTNDGGLMTEVTFSELKTGNTKNGSMTCAPASM